MAVFDLIVGDFAAHAAAVDVPVERGGAAFGLAFELGPAPAVLELGQDVLDEGREHDGRELAVREPDELAHPRALHRAVGL